MKKLPIKGFKAGELVWHKKHHRWAVVTSVDTYFRQWVQVLFVGDDTPHDAFAQWLERIEDNNEKTN
jgi:hypothetical protein